jgi:hypothetical protein
MIPHGTGVWLPHHFPNSETAAALKALTARPEAAASIEERPPTLSAHRCRSWCEAVTTSPWLLEASSGSRRRAAGCRWGAGGPEPRTTSLPTQCALLDPAGRALQSARSTSRRGSADDCIHDPPAEGGALRVTLPVPVSGGRSLLVLRRAESCRCGGPRDRSCGSDRRAARDPPYGRRGSRQRVRRADERLAMDAIVAVDVRRCASWTNRDIERGVAPRARFVERATVCHRDC